MLKFPKTKSKKYGASKYPSKVKPLKTKLDTVFSKYIRLRDQVSPGICRCFTCGKLVPILKIHCGHFVPRTKLSTRFNESNCHAQCCLCNTFKEGEHYMYGLLIDKKYGKGTAERLYLSSKLSSKLSSFEYEKLIEYYSNKVKEMGGDNYWGVKKLYKQAL